jgi:phenylpropionate dioxygenase-like ring-hydroxylating dioxygenase large terminal subunit
MYHGLRFDPTGRCVEIPGVLQVPPKVRVRSYPVVVRNRWVFVWMGDPARADESALPDNYSCDHPQWRNLPGYLHYETPYELICDNLLDFSHLSYVHERTLGGATAIAQSRPTIEEIPRGVRVTRWVPDVPAPPLHLIFRDLRGVRVNRWFNYDFVLPGTLLMESGSRPVDDAPDDERRTVRLHSCQTLTPETASTTHYFFQQSHPADVGDDSSTRALFEQLLVAFEEDRRMITAQSRNLSANNEPMMTLWMDDALVRFRRLRERLMQAEG